MERGAVALDEEEGGRGRATGASTLEGENLILLSMGRSSEDSEAPWAVERSLLFEVDVELDPFLSSTATDDEAAAVEVPSESTTAGFISTFSMARLEGLVVSGTSDSSPTSLNKDAGA